MTENSQNCGERATIVLPVPSALSGACRRDNGFAAVDGHTPYIYLFTSDGCFTAAVPSRRPYGSISTNDGESYVCAGCGCDTNVYYLNERLEETDAMTPEGRRGAVKSASFYTSPPYDGCVAVTSTHCVKLYRRSGEYVKTIKEYNENIVYNCYQSIPDGESAAFEKDGAYYVSVSDDASGENGALTLPRCSTPKSLIMAPCGDLWCVIGRRFVYNDVVTLFTDRIFDPDRIGK